MEAERSAFSKLATRVRSRRPLVLFRSEYFKCFSNGSYFQNRMVFRDLRLLAHTSLAQTAGPVHTQSSPHDYKPAAKKPLPMIQVGYLDEM